MSSNDPTRVKSIYITVEITILRQIERCHADPWWNTRMTGIIKIMFIVSCIQYSGEVCSLGRIIEFCTGHVNLQKYYYLLNYYGNLCDTTICV